MLTISRVFSGFLALVASVYSSRFVLGFFFFCSVCASSIGLLSFLPRGLFVSALAFILVHWSHVYFFSFWLVFVVPLGVSFSLCGFLFRSVFVFLSDLLPFISVYIRPFLPSSFILPNVSGLSFLLCGCFLALRSC